MSDHSYVGRRLCITVPTRRGTDDVPATVLEHRIVGSSSRGTHQHVVTLRHDDGNVRENVRLSELCFLWVEERMPGACVVVESEEEEEDEGDEMELEINFGPRPLKDLQPNVPQGNLQVGVGAALQMPLLPPPRSLSRQMYFQKCLTISAVCQCTVRLLNTSPSSFVFLSTPGKYSRCAGQEVDEAPAFRRGGRGKRTRPRVVCCDASPLDSCLILSVSLMLRRQPQHRRLLNDLCWGSIPRREPSPVRR